MTGVGWEAEWQILAGYAGKAESQLVNELRSQRALNIAVPIVRHIAILQYLAEDEG